MVGEKERFVMSLQAEVVSALEEVSKELARHFDVEDGDYDGPRPNWAMRLHSQVEYALDHQHPEDLEQACLDSIEALCGRVKLERRDGEARLNQAGLIVVRLTNIARQFQELDEMERAERMAEDLVARGEWEADLRADEARDRPFTTEGDL